MAALTSAAMLGGAGFLSLAGAYSQSEAQKLQGEYQKQQYGFNAEVAGLQAKDALKRGDEQAQLVLKKGAQIQGEQRVALAAQGVDVGTGTAADLQAETAMMAAKDAETVRANAWREAWGYKVQATNYGFEGTMARNAAQNNSRLTLLTGGVQALGYGVQAAGAYRGGK